ncbi:hypothetical protein Tco_1099542, partial [Tanacetum coccineum]
VHIYSEGIRDCFNKMNGAAMVAIIATIGNLLQGWDNATIAEIRNELENRIQRNGIG